MRKKDKSPSAYILLISLSILWMGLSTIGAYWYSSQTGSHFIPPGTLSTDTWESRSTDVKANSQKRTTGSGVQIIDDALQINRYTTISPKAQTRTSEVEVILDSTSDPIQLQLVDGYRSNFLELGFTHFRSQSDGDWLPCHCDGFYRVSMQRKEIWLLHGEKRSMIASGSFDRFRIAVESGNGALNSIRAWDANNLLFIEEDFRNATVPDRMRNIGALMGFALGAFAILALWKGRLLASIFLYIPAMYVPPAWVAAQTHAKWNLWIEKLYLTQTTAWQLATIALWCALLPAVMLFVGHLGLGLRSLSSKPQNRVPIIISWSILATLTMLLSNREAGLHWGIIFQIIFLSLPHWLAWRSKIPTKGWLLRDTPSFVALGIFGWGIGLLIATLWRLTLIVSSVSLLKDSHSRPTADSLFILLLLLPVGIELSIRDTYLNTAWHVDTLSAKYNSKDPSEYLVAMWSASCGKRSGKKPNITVFIGGSSTGGDYQFRQTPHLFFAGQSHSLLCDRLPKGQRLVTQNFGRGAMDTHIIAHSMDTLYHTSQADLIVMYVGNNDLLTKKSPLSKKQLRNQSEHWKSQLTGIQHYTAKTRLVIGSSLLFRQLQPQEQLAVSVPLPDAKENFEQIAQKAKEHNTKILLLTEYINPSLFQRRGQSGVKEIQENFQEYTEIQRQIAQENENVYYFDIWSALSPYAHEDLFIDNNHLNMQGNRRVAQVLEPIIADVLGWENP
ncbi:MAG: GDSL-type esterase/lipase family protein [Myxococcota bacterium]|nr:GDSL-type esterase/lipase family protein [Myxococcota bacterium]